MESKAQEARTIKQQNLLQQLLQSRKVTKQLAREVMSKERKIVTKRDASVIIEYLLARIAFSKNFIDPRKQRKKCDECGRPENVERYFEQDGRVTNLCENCHFEREHATYHANEERLAEIQENENLKR